MSAFAEPNLFLKKNLFLIIFARYNFSITKKSKKEFTVVKVLNQD